MIPHIPQGGVAKCNTPWQIRRKVFAFRLIRRLRAGFERERGSRPPLSHYPCQVYLQRLQPNPILQQSLFAGNGSLIILGVPLRMPVNFRLRGQGQSRRLIPAPHRRWIHRRRENPRSRPLLASANPRHFRAHTQVRPYDMVGGACVLARVRWFLQTCAASPGLPRRRICGILSER